MKAWRSYDVLDAGDGIAGVAATDPYRQTLAHLQVPGTVQVATLVAAVFLSVLRPWGRRSSTP